MCPKLNPHDCAQDHIDSCSLTCKCLLSEVELTTFHLKLAHCMRHFKQLHPRHTHTHRRGMCVHRSIRDGNVIRQANEIQINARCECTAVFWTIMPNHIRLRLYYNICNGDQSSNIMCDCSRIDDDDDDVEIGVYNCHACIFAVVVHLHTNCGRINSHAITLACLRRRRSLAHR